MLLLMMELKGKINHRMIKKASFGTMHFDESLNFISIEKDKITGQVSLNPSTGRHEKDAHVGFRKSPRQWSSTRLQKIFGPVLSPRHLFS